MSTVQIPQPQATTPAPIVVQPGTQLHRLLRKAQLLLAEQKPGMMLVRSDNGVLTIWRVQPDGRSE